MQAVFFDVDGTLASSNVVRCYLDFKLRRLTPLACATWLLLFLPRLPYYWLLDKISRRRFNKAFFRNYEGVLVADMESWAKDTGEEFWREKLFAEAVARLEHHRSQGHHLILMSGGVEPALRPLARLLSVELLACARLETEGALFTGKLVEGPMSGEAKAQAVQRIGANLGLDLQQCYAYADSYSDREFLEVVGYPTAVNPDRRLRRLARARGWPIRRWKSHGQLPKSI